MVLVYVSLRIVDLVKLDVALGSSKTDTTVIRLRHSYVEDTCVGKKLWMSTLSLSLSLHIYTYMYTRISNVQV